jgi:hypothetical protein
MSIITLTTKQIYGDIIVEKKVQHLYQGRIYRNAYYQHKLFALPLIVFQDYLKGDITHLFLEEKSDIILTEKGMTVTLHYKYAGHLNCIIH